MPRMARWVGVFAWMRATTSAPSATIPVDRIRGSENRADFSRVDRQMYQEIPMPEISRRSEKKFWGSVSNSSGSGGADGDWQLPRLAPGSEASRGRRSWVAGHERSDGLPALGELRAACNRAEPLLRRQTPTKAPRRARMCEHRKHRTEHHKPHPYRRLLRQAVVLSEHGGVYKDDRTRPCDHCHLS